MKLFTNEALFEIINYLKNELLTNDYVQIKVLNPDLLEDSYSGTKISIDEVEYTYRSYHSYMDLSNILFCKFLTPKYETENIVVLTFKKLNQNNSFHKDSDDTEKYGEDSQFSLINKNEEASFLHYYSQALKNCKIETRDKILNLGINRADEFDVIEKLLTKEEVLSKKFVGVDYSASAISQAKKKFPFPNFDFYCHDINSLDSLNLEKSDLIISIGTLQSSNLNFKELFMNIVQNYLEKDGSLIFAFPNSRWIGGELIYGAKAPNYSFSEQSILYKDVYFCKKYLQQKKFRVTITGKDYIFITATSIRK